MNLAAAMAAQVSWLHRGPANVTHQQHNAKTMDLSRSLPIGTAPSLAFSKNSGWGCRPVHTSLQVLFTRGSSSSSRLSCTTPVLAELRNPIPDASESSTSVEHVEEDGDHVMAWKTSSTAWGDSAGGGENNPMLERLNTEVNNHNEGDMWREECGVVGIFGDPEASRLCYLALHALQHRGQEGAGIVTSNNGTLHTVTGKLIDSYTQLHNFIDPSQGNCNPQHLFWLCTSVDQEHSKKLSI